MQTQWYTERLLTKKSCCMENFAMLVDLDQVSMFPRLFPSKSCKCCHWDTLQNLEPSECDTVTPGSAETTFNFFVVFFGQRRTIFFLPLK